PSLSHPTSTSGAAVRSNPAAVSLFGDFYACRQTFHVKHSRSKKPQKMEKCLLFYRRLCYTFTTIVLELNSAWEKPLLLSIRKAAWAKRPRRSTFLRQS